MKRRRTKDRGSSGRTAPGFRRRCWPVLAVLLSVIAAAGGTGHDALCGTDGIALEASAAAVDAAGQLRGGGPSSAGEAGSALPVLRQVRYEKPSRAADAGVRLSKTVTALDADTWRITLEAYVTGTEQEVMTPADVVLLLDTSGSMNFTYEGGQTRLDALKTSACSFLDELAALNEGKTEDSQLRVGLEKFCNTKDTGVYREELLRLDQKNAAAMKTWVNELTTGNLTMTDLAMSDARDLLSKSGEGRRKAVILFTDGQPNASDGLQPDTANKALAAALEIKKAGGEIYVISIVPGAYAGNGGLLPAYEKLAGDDGKDTKFIYMSPSVTYDNPNCPPVNTTEENMTNLTNRFMHLISSNNPTARNLDVPDEDASKPGRTVAENGINYYMTAADPQALTNAFSTLVYRIGSASADLGVNSQLRDEVTSWFLPDPASLAVYTAPRVKKEDGSFAWGERVKLESESGVTAVVQSDHRTIVVRGFDYSTQYVSEQGHVDQPENFGSKLICEFLIRRDNLIGGNQVPTNTAESGLYRTRYLKSAAGFFDLPYVDVPIRYAVKAMDYAVYVPDRINLSGMLSYLPEYTPDGNNNSFVSISYVLKDETGESLWAQDIAAATKPEKDSWNWNRAKTDCCRTYDIGCTIMPTQSGQVPDWNSRIQASAHVYRPTLVLRDTWRKTGSVADAAVGDSTTTSGLRRHYVQTVWHCDDNKVKSLPENEPKLGFRITPLTGIERRGEKYYLATEDAAPFQVEVFRSTKGKLTDNITADTTFAHQCDVGNCDFDIRKSKDSRISFLIHGSGTDESEPEDGSGRDGNGTDPGDGSGKGGTGTDQEGGSGNGKDGTDPGDDSDDSGKGGTGTDQEDRSGNGEDGRDSDNGSGKDGNGADTGSDAGTGHGSGSGSSDGGSGTGGKDGSGTGADGSSADSGNGGPSGDASGGGTDGSGSASGGNSGNSDGSGSTSGGNAGSSDGSGSHGSHHHGGSSSQGNGGSNGNAGSSGSGSTGGITVINNMGDTPGVGSSGNGTDDSNPAYSGINGMDGGSGSDSQGLISGRGLGSESPETGDGGAGRNASGGTAGKGSRGSHSYGKHTDEQDAEGRDSADTLQKRPLTGDKDGLTGWFLIAAAAGFLLGALQLIRHLERSSAGKEAD